MKRETVGKRECDGESEGMSDWEREAMREIMGKGE